MNRNKWIFLVLLGLLFMILLYKSPRARALANHGQRLRTLAKEHDLSWPFVMSLYVMECQGQQACPNTYHPSIFRALKKVQTGEREEFHGVYVHHIIAATDNALRDLATSWGPFQLKGYQIIPLGIPLSHLRTRTLEVSILWLSGTHQNASKENCSDIFLHHATQQYVYHAQAQYLPEKYALQACKHMDFFAKVEEQL